MPRSTSTVVRRFKVVAITMGVLVLIYLGIALKLNHEVRVVRSTSGTLVKLEGYAFRPGTVRYDLPNRPMARLTAKVFSETAKKRIKWLCPERTVFAQASFPREPLLSAAFSSRDLGGKWQEVGSRLAISDDRGQTFDSLVNYLGNGGVFEAPAFPRRGKKLRLRLMDGDKLLAEFRIPNPCSGPHPVWQPEATPVTATNTGLEITLESFVSDAGRNRTFCTFLVREDGKENKAWQPSVFEVSDATGNHWRPAADAPQQIGNARVRGCFLGALWAEEHAWKLRVEFKPVGEDAATRPARTVEFLVKPEQVTGDLPPTATSKTSNTQ